MKKNEIMLATIGLVGVVATGVFSNWDKMFPREDIVQEQVISGYKPTGNFETELRYFLEVSGTRANVKQMQSALLNAQKVMLMKQYPDRAAKIDTILATVEKEMPQFDQIVDIMLPVYQKHFKIEEMQELNKFYSTQPMQDMVSKMPLVTQELAPLEAQLIQEFQQRMIPQIVKEMTEEGKP